MSKKEQLYNQIIEQVSKIVKKHINELKNTTYNDAHKKFGDIYSKLVKDNPNAGDKSEPEDRLMIDEEAFQKYIKTVKNPKTVQRLLKLKENGKLLPFLVRRMHLFGTYSNFNFGWFSEHNISLSPKFFEATGNSFGKAYKNTNRKPTEQEEKFYRFFTTCGADTEGMSDKEVENFKKITTQYWVDTTGVNPFEI